jgi:N-hydroxyarylamine O-acetyltransferase
MTNSVQRLPEELIETVLAKLGLSGRPEPTLQGLAAVYAAWCRRVPFDNIRKLIHLRRGDPGPLPGDSALDFFEHWTRFGTGGTCWAGNGALCVLLESLGFAAQRALGSMLAAPNPPPGLPSNHGSTTVQFDTRVYMVDASILHGEPLLLQRHGAAPTPPRAWSVTCDSRDGRWHIAWRPLHRPSGIDCRLDEFDAAPATCRELHERSRSFSPFNAELTVRLNRGEAVIGAGFGQQVVLQAGGEIVQRPLQGNDRLQFLIDEIGIHEELAAALPPDAPTPPPDGSAQPPDVPAPRPGGD